MVRTCLCSFAGAAVGFLFGLVLVVLIPLTAGAGLPSEAVPIGALFGGFLAGTGTVAGALIGGVADLLAYFKRRDEAARNAQKRCESQSRL